MRLVIAVALRLAVVGLAATLAWSARARAHCPPAGVEIREYDALQPGARGWIDIRWDGRAWVPARPLSMPLHHASRIEWIDAAQRPELAAHDRVLRVAIVAVDRHLERSIHPGVLVDATYRVRIESVCAP